MHGRKSRQRAGKEARSVAWFPAGWFPAWGAQSTARSSFLSVTPAQPSRISLPPPKPLFIGCRIHSHSKKKKINRFSKRKRPSKPTHCSLYHFRLLLHPHSQFQPLEFLFPSQRGQGGSLGSWTEAAQHPRGAILKADPSRLPGSRAVIPGTAAGGRKGFPCSISFHPTPSEDRSPVASSNQEMRAVQEIWGWEARRIHKNPSRFFWLALGDFLGHYPIRQYMIFTKQNVIFDFLTSSCTVCNFFS